MLLSRQLHKPPKWFCVSFTLSPKAWSSNISMSAYLYLTNLLSVRILYPMHSVCGYCAPASRFELP